jgi:hypothetical protein
MYVREEGRTGQDEGEELEVRGKEKGSGKGKGRIQESYSTG